MTSISNVYSLVVGLDSYSDTTIQYTMSIAISLAVFTWFYTSVAGLPASIVTDKFQAYLMFSLVFILLIVATAAPQNRIVPAEFAVASNWTSDGLVAAITLFIAVSCAEMFNQGTWQRVWAAKSVPDMRKGFILGSGMVFLLMMFFGIMGMIAYANDPEAYDNYEKFACENILLYCLTGSHDSFVYVGLPECIFLKRLFFLSISFAMTKT